MNLIKNKIFIFIISFNLFAFVSLAQVDRRQIKETKNFYNAIRDSVLANPKYGKFIINDTLLLRDYLCNKGVFGGMVLYGDSSSLGFLNDNDKKNLLFLIKNDTTKYYISNNFIRKSIVAPDKKEFVYLRLSKPIFFKKYTLCVFCIGSPEGNTTLLYRKINDTNWVFVKKIGYITTY
ncbi:MAG: hypothetical protein WCG67_01475 [Ferruginibacter sp.]